MYNYEVELFDRYNNEGHRTQDEFEADAFDELEGGYDYAEEGDPGVYDPTLNYNDWRI